MQHSTSRSESGSPRGGHPGSADRDAAEQTLLNEAPFPPPGIHHDVPRPIPVTARLVWERDGEVRIATEALEWTSTLVRVRVADTRARTGTVWLHARDVERRAVYDTA